MGKESVAPLSLESSQAGEDNGNQLREFQKSEINNFTVLFKTEGIGEVLT